MFNKILKTYGLIVATSSIAFCAEKDINPSYMLSAEKIQWPMPLTPPPPTLGKADANYAAEKAGQVKLTPKSSCKRGAIKDVFPEISSSTPLLKTSNTPAKKVSKSKVKDLIEFFTNLTQLKKQ